MYTHCLLHGLTARYDHCTVLSLGQPCTLLVADSGSRIPPTDLLGAVSFSTKTLSNSGISRFDMADSFRLAANQANRYFKQA